MMRKVLFRDRQEARAADFNNLQDYNETTLDHIVADAITDDARYKGLAVSQVSGTEVNVASGRLYDGGRVYDRVAASQKNLIADLPVANKRYVTVVAYGVTQETNVEPRDFLINLEDETTEPQSVAMMEIRECKVAYINGSESVAPNPSAVPSGQVKVADILLDPTGIVSITMSETTRLGGLEGANTKIRSLSTWRYNIAPRVDTLQSTLSDVRRSLLDLAPISRVIDTERDLNALWRVLGLPQGVTGYQQDEFLEGELTDDSFSDEAYFLEDGLHFPSSDSASVALDLFNAIDSSVKKSANGWLLPAYTNETALETSGANGEVNLSSYTVTTTETESYTAYKTVRRSRTRRVRKRKFVHREKGWSFLQDESGRSENGVPFGTEQNIKGLAAGGWDYKGDTYETKRYTYSDRVPVTRYRTVTSTDTITGMTLAQTVLSPRAMWVTSIGLNFSDLDSSGDVTVVLARATSNGRPNRKDVISKTTVPYSDLSAGSETNVVLEPAFVEAGERVAIILVTNGSHKHQIVQGVEDTQGAIFHGSDNGWQPTEDGKSLMFSLYGARFNRARTEIRLKDVNLSGGITELVIEAEEVAPTGTDISFEYQHNGVWYDIRDAETLVQQMPSTVPLRMVVTGTTTLQPAILTGNDKVKAAIADTAMKHYSTIIALQSASSEVYVDVDVNFFDASNETIDVRLLDADNSDAEVTASATQDVEVSNIHDREGVDTGMDDIRKRWTFTPASIQNFRVQITGSTNASATRPFAIAERQTSWVA